MGASHSTERDLFEQVLCSLLRGTNDWETVVGVAMFFIGFTALVLIWKRKAGKRIREHYQAHGPEKTPVDAFSLRSPVRDCLRGDSEFDKWEKGTRSSLRVAGSAENLLLPLLCRVLLRPFGSHQDMSNLRLISLENHNLLILQRTGSSIWIPNTLVWPCEASATAAIGLAAKEVFAEVFANSPENAANPSPGNSLNRSTDSAALQPDTS